MAALRELAEDYRDSAARCRIALEDARAEKDEVKIRQLRAMLKEMRDLRKMCETYYELPRDRKYTL